MKGKIKFYNAAREYGFVTPDDSSGDIHFSTNALPRERRYDPAEGDPVEFDVREGDRGRFAVRMVLVGQAAA